MINIILIFNKFKVLDTGIISEEFSKETNAKQYFLYDISFNMIEINNETN